MTEEDLASNESRIGPDFAAPVMPHYSITEKYLFTVVVMKFKGM